MTVPTRGGIGSSLWRLQHVWQESPKGLLVNSTQVVGVVAPGWRPLWYARWRNALVQGLFGRGRDPTWMLQQWLQHCVEEVSLKLGHCLRTAMGLVWMEHQGCADHAAWPAAEVKAAVLGSWCMARLRPQGHGTVACKAQQHWHCLPFCCVWLQCPLQVGNLEHILPSLYAAAAATKDDGDGARGEGHGTTGGLRDEL